MLAVVFDLDGTLIDSVPAVAAALNRVLAEEGRSPLSVERVKEMVGHGARATVVRALEATGGGGNDAAWVDAVMERYLVAYLDDPAAATVVYPDVRRVLDAYAAAGVPMGICTNKPGATTRPVLEALGLDRYFRAVLTADDTCHRKPDGRHIRETLAAMGAERLSAVYVGDSETDVAAAHDAGLPAVLVTWGYCRLPPSQVGADVLIERFGDLPRAVTRLTATQERPMTEARHP